LKYNPDSYFSDIDTKKFIDLNEVIVGNKHGATFVTTMGKFKSNTLVDTGATRCCINKDYFDKLSLPPLQTLMGLSVRSASGSNMQPMGITKSTFQLGDKEFTHEFIVCKNLSRPCILGLDFLHKHRIGFDWSERGDRILTHQRQVLIECLEEFRMGPQIKARYNTKIPGRSYIVLNVKVDLKEEDMGHFYDIQINDLLQDEYPNLRVIPAIHKVDAWKHVTLIPYLMVNLCTEAVFLQKNEILGFLTKSEVTIENILTETVYEALINNETGLKNEGNAFEKKEQLERRFITSPADVETHRSIELENTTTSKKQRYKMQRLCGKYKDIFSTSSSDIGKTPLITMHIDTGTSAPISQRPYNLPLKHAEWVAKEIGELEKAGTIIRSVSPWASPIVVVPKKTEPGELPKRRLCVDYRALNKLLSPVDKVGSKAKGVLTLVPLPKIDEIYGRLKGSKVYSSLD
jgi:predicted aspartyl protease